MKRLLGSHKRLALQLALLGGVGLTFAVTIATDEQPALAGGECPSEAECAAAQPRVMFLLDASSSMLNINGGTSFGGPGQTGWDQARELIGGEGSIHAVELPSGVRMSEVFHVGLAVFGHQGEQKVVVDYGPCRAENVEWALDPLTSCEQPGCDDPWGGPPITWTFKDGSLVDPLFADSTLSHMPSCSPINGNNFCAGSGTYTNLGLQLIKDNQAAYVAAAMQPNAPYPVDAQTKFYNILITDGLYVPYATDAAVQAELEQMYAAGITTYVIGFGDALDAPSAIAKLEAMADWGSGGTLDYHDANNQAQLETVLVDIVSGIQLDVDPCCVTFDCGDEPPRANGDDEPDPLPSDDAESTDSMSESGDSTTDAGDSGDSTGDSGDSTTDSGDSTTDSGDSTTDSDGSTSGETGTDSGPGNDEVGDESGTGNDAGVSEQGDGCSCSTATTSPGAPLASLLSLGLLGFVRRQGRRGAKSARR